MISNAFKSAEAGAVSGKAKSLMTISSAVKDIGTLVMGVAGFSGGLGTGMLAKASQYNFASKIGGVGGALMMLELGQKEQNVKDQKAFSLEEVQSTVKSSLGDNPINRAAVKKLNTVFGTLSDAKEQGLVNKKGQYTTNMGDVDPNSPLGKAITKELSK